MRAELTPADIAKVDQAHASALAAARSYVEPAHEMIEKAGSPALAVYAIRAQIVAAEWHRAYLETMCAVLLVELARSSNT
jgi:hypothetical protein